jgi:hypothetical protein
VSHALTAWLFPVVGAEIDGDVEEMLHVLLWDRKVLELAWCSTSTGTEAEFVLAIQEWNRLIMILTASEKNLPWDHLSLAVVLPRIEWTKLAGSTEDGL